MKASEAHQERGRPPIGFAMASSERIPGRNSHELLALRIVHVGQLPGRQLRAARVVMRNYTISGVYRRVMKAAENTMASIQRELRTPYGHACRKNHVLETFYYNLEVSIDTILNLLTCGSWSVSENNRKKRC